MVLLAKLKRFILIRVLYCTIVVFCIFVYSVGELKMVRITIVRKNHRETLLEQARNQDLMWGGGGGANEAKVDQTTAMYFLFYSSIKLETSEFVIGFFNFSFIFKIFSKI